MEDNGFAGLSSMPRWKKWTFVLLAFVVFVTISVGGVVAPTQRGTEPVHGDEADARAEGTVSLVRDLVAAVKADDAAFEKPESPEEAELMVAAAHRRAMHAASIADQLIFYTESISAEGHDAPFRRAASLGALTKEYYAASGRRWHVVLDALEGSESDQALSKLNHEISVIVSRMESERDHIEEWAASH